jgi:myosin heavy subunit
LCEKLHEQLNDEEKAKVVEDAELERLITDNESLKKKVAQLCSESDAGELHERITELELQASAIVMEKKTLSHDVETAKAKADRAEEALTKTREELKATKDSMNAMPAELAAEKEKSKHSEERVAELEHELHEMQEHHEIPEKVDPKAKDTIIADLMAKESSLATALKAATAASKTSQEVIRWGTLLHFRHFNGFQPSPTDLQSPIDDEQALFIIRFSCRPTSPHVLQRLHSRSSLPDSRVLESERGRGNTHSSFTQFVMPYNSFTHASLRANEAEETHTVLSLSS